MSTFGEAVGRLKNAQKSNTGAAAYSRFVNRPIGRVFAAAAFTRGMTPNQVTVLSSVFTYTGISLLFWGPAEVWTGLTTGLLLMIGYALDSADGQLARLRGGGSPAGEWLDHMSDALKMSSIHLGVLVMWFRHYDVPTAMLAVPLGFQIVSSVFYVGVILTEVLRRPLGLTSSGGVLRTRWFFTFAVLPTDYGLMILLMFTIGWPQFFTPVYTIVAILHALLLLAALPRWYRSLARPST